MSAVQWVKKDGNLGQFYRAVQPVVPGPSGIWSITAQIFNNGSLVSVGWILPPPQLNPSSTLDALIPQKVDEFFKQYVQPSMVSNQWARAIAVKADAVNPQPPGPGQSVSQPWYVKCYATSGMGTPCQILPLTPGEFEARFGTSIKLFNMTQTQTYRAVQPRVPQWHGLRGVQWLGRVVSTLGATDAEIVQIKSLLSTWAQGEGSQSAAFQNYGTKPEDYVPPFTTVRDGATLESFSVWWNSGGKPPHLQTGQGNIASAPPDAEHLQALLNWAASHGINPNQVPPQQPPTPMDLSTCLSQCQNLYGLDPIQYATCAAACAQKFPLIPPPVPISPAPTQPPVSPSPAPTPTIPPPTTPSTSSESKSSPWPWVIGGAALLGLGALIVAGGR